jgi:BirA family transcriptional regulator, biotin operon repressor / biotin---[acetyl-CoA-carboxylase] ligase
MWMADRLPVELAEALRAAGARLGRLGDPSYYFHQTTSTNDLAAGYADRGAPEGTMVIAGAQTAGRGRLGRGWHSPPGAGLYLSVVIRDVRAAPYLTLAGGVAVAEGIRISTGLPLEIKWPNDVVTPGTSGPSRRRKVAGVLAEASSSSDGLQHVILGIGINITPASYPSELADRASSVEAELGRAVEPGRVLAEVLAALAGELARLAAGDAAPLLDRWRRLAPSAVGAPVECDTPGGRVRGIASGIADDGALFVKVGNRVERVIAGEVVWK